MCYINWLLIVWVIHLFIILTDWLIEWLTHHCSNLVTYLLEVKLFRCFQRWLHFAEQNNWCSVDFRKILGYFCNYGKHFVSFRLRSLWLGFRLLTQKHQKFEKTAVGDWIVFVLERGYKQGKSMSRNTALSIHIIVDGFEQSLREHFRALPENFTTPVPNPIPIPNPNANPNRNPKP